MIGMEANQEDAAIVASTIGLANSLGLHVIAEGVENAEVLDQLRAMGCHQAQGYHMCRPRPAEDLGEWLQPDRLASTA